MKKLKSSKKAFDNCNWRQLALKMSYNGRNFHGFESCNSSRKNAIEDHLFIALNKVKIINTEEPENYTKCGRTDRGVSAYNNVVSLKVREQNLEIYKRSLNGVLPEEIRILDAAFVDDDFNARFNCIEREYRYFFLRKDMDIDLMRKASQDLVGKHDFRNFCKFNVMATTNYIRRINSIEIHEVHDVKFNPWFDENGKRKEVKNPFDQLYIKIRANAFLWHQIRCIVTILFNIGLKIDSPDAIKDLLDIEKNPRRPGYHFANPHYLVLSDCVFKEDPFEKKEDTDINDYDHTKDPMNAYSNKIEDLLLQTSMIGYMLRKRKPEKKKVKIPKREKKVSIYVNSLCFTVEETIANLRGSKLKRYKNILDWKKRKGLEDPYKHVKFIEDEDKQNDKE